jgi:hypothetical protein
LNAAIRDGEKAYFGGFGYDEFKYYAPHLLQFDDYSRLDAAMDAGDAFWLVYYGEQYLETMPQVLRAKVLDRSTVAFSYQGRAEQAFDPHESYVRRFPPRMARPESISSLSEKSVQWAAAPGNQ